MRRTRADACRLTSDDEGKSGLSPKMSDGTRHAALSQVTTAKFGRHLSLHRERGDNLVMSPHRDRRYGRAGATLDLERLDDEGELVDLLRGKLLELEILEQMHAVHDQRELVHRQRDLRIRVG